MSRDNRHHDEHFVCPHCGAEVKANAQSCSECGSDEKTGWSQETIYDNTGIPEEDSHIVGAEEAKKSKNIVLNIFMWIIVVVIVIRLSI